MLRAVEIDHDALDELDGDRLHLDSPAEELECLCASAWTPFARNTGSISRTSRLTSAVRPCSGAEAYRLLAEEFLLRSREVGRRG